MVVTNVSLENYKSYYGMQSFDFANGFNVVLGDNGDGKTKLIESIRWFLTGLTTDGSKSLASKAAIHDLELNSVDIINVSVEMEFSDVNKGRKLSIKKTFALKRSNGKIQKTDIHYEGIESTINGESIFHQDALYLLKEAVPEVIRPYTVFQGESELNILNTSSDSIERLVNVFINESLLKSLQLKAQKIRRKAEIAVEKEAAKNKKNASLLNNLESNINKHEREIGKIRTKIAEYEKDRDFSEKKMQELNDILAQAEEFDSYRNELSKIDSERSRLVALLKEDYTTYIFDEAYLLDDFEAELEKFNSTIIGLEAEQRTMEFEHQQKIGEKNAIAVIQKALISDSNPLPVGVPSQNYMAEMLRDEICKVCNRRAKTGSQEHEYMKNHMQAILKKISNNTGLDKDVLFKSQNVKSLHDEITKGFTGGVKRLLSNKKEDYSALREFNMARYIEISGLDRRKEECSDRITAITGFTGLKGDTLAKHLNDWHIYSENYKERVQKIGSLNNQLEDSVDRLTELKKQQQKIINDAGVNDYLIRALDVASKQAEIFKEIREKDINQILRVLEDKTNQIFDKLNVHAFKGRLKINGGLNEHTDKISVKIEHVVNKGEVFTGANQALETSANIALLLAVMEISKERQIGSFPIFMDAPVSSFGKKKIGQFMQMMNEIPNQCIVVMKEYLEPYGDDVRVSTEFEALKPNKAFRIKLERPFDRQDLRTVKTKVHKI